jgi:hypothetical protein
MPLVAGSTPKASIIWSTVPFDFGASVVASFLLGLCISYANGAYSESALLCILFALLTLVWQFGRALGVRPAVPSAATTLAGVVFIACVGALWCAFNDGGLILYAQKKWELGRDAQLANGGLLVSYLPALVLGKREPPRLRHARFALLGLAALLAGIDVIKTSPTPAIDVWDVQMRGAAAFAHGINPFTAITAGNTAPGSVGAVPYVYPPAQVYLSFLGWKLLGDVRYTMLFAIVATGVVLRFIARRARRDVPSLIEDAPALLIWFMPKLFFILEQAWVDPVQIMLLALAIAAHVERRVWTCAVVLGVCIASKQTMIWIVPLAFFMLRMKWREGALMIGVAAALTLPYVVWDAKALKYALFDFQALLPPRPDGLTFRNWVQRKFAFEAPSSIAFLGAAGVTAVACWRLRARGVAFMPAAAALAYVVFFAFNKWAFANYYFLVAGLAAIAAAASLHEAREETT